MINWKHPLLQDNRPIHELHFSTRHPVVGGIYMHQPTKQVYVVLANGCSVEDERTMDYYPCQVVLQCIDTQDIIMMDHRRMAELDNSNQHVWLKRYSEHFEEPDEQLQ